MSNETKPMPDFCCQELVDDINEDHLISVNIIKGEPHLQLCSIEPSGGCLTMNYCHHCGVVITFPNVNSTKELRFGGFLKRSMGSECFQEFPDGFSRSEIIELGDMFHQENNPYKTACESINPDNPMAVADNLKNVEYFLKTLLATDEFFLPEIIKPKAQELLTKIQSK